MMINTHTKIFLVLMGLLVSTASHAVSHPTVCTMTFSALDEKHSFERILVPQFNLIELPLLFAKKTGAPPADWFDLACKSKIQCDVLVISGEFTDKFYGPRAPEISLDQLQAHACNHTCDGILHHPQEVFLFGDNTLLKKQSSSLDDLREVSESNLVDQRLAQSKVLYLGESNADRMNLIFSGVPRIFGFVGVLPGDDDFVPHLDHFLNGHGDYQAHLLRDRGFSSKDKVVSKINKDCPSFIQTSGNNLEDLADQWSCKLTKESDLVSDRIHEINSMQFFGDLRVNLAAIQRFFNAHPIELLSTKEREALAALKQNTLFKNWFRRILAEYKFSLPKLEAAIFGWKMEWVDQETFSQIRYETFMEMINEFNDQTDSVDLVCESLKYDPHPLPVMLSSISAEMIYSQNGKRFLDCLGKLIQ